MSAGFRRRNCRYSTESIRPDVAPWRFQLIAWHAAAMHCVAMGPAEKDYLNYIYDRDGSSKRYADYWLRSWRRKLVVSASNQRFQKTLFSNRQPYFSFRFNTTMMRKSCITALP